MDTNKTGDNKNIPIPLIISFSKPIADMNNFTEPVTSNSFYNTESFQRIPFYKPISLLKYYKTNLDSSIKNI
jgi:hypothetical protein